MKPTNTKERTQAKVRFLLFLVVTMALVIAAIFFDYQIPEKENKLLRTNMKKNNELLAAEEAFANQMRSVKGLLDSMDIEGVNA
ncbi:MAG: type VI secretion system transmembrane protein TssO, partial [Bacteroidales bacterium]|nr:type VI secretion system transmembrane protein TssO [Bacteroidales bacterium]